MSMPCRSFSTRLCFNNPSVSTDMASLLKQTLKKKSRTTHVSFYRGHAIVFLSGLIDLQEAVVESVLGLIPSLMDNWPVFKK